MALAILRLNMIRFNTSHVVVYRTKTTDNFGYVASFNTSHVVVYPYFFLKKLLTFMFQYISCCSLSIVIEKIPDIESVFQYISCCSLSTIVVTTNTF